MILFVFEGVSEEPIIMETVKHLFFNDCKEMVQCAYGSDTHTFVKEVKELMENGGEVDIFSVVKERMNARGDFTLDNFTSDQFEATYLFFDYDPQNSTISLDQLNRDIIEITSILSNADENGMVFISYPMIEALYCENSIPDDSFCDYQVDIDELMHGKEWNQIYDCAKKKYKVILKAHVKDGHVVLREEATSERLKVLLESWKSLINSNIIKANYLCNGAMEIPAEYEQISSEKIFSNQLSKFVTPEHKVSILSAFPLFLFEYFGEKIQI